MFPASQNPQIATRVREVQKSESGPSQPNQLKLSEWLKTGWGFYMGLLMLGVHYT